MSRQLGSHLWPEVTRTLCYLPLLVHDTLLDYALLVPTRY
jgi:hypothetical protein